MLASKHGISDLCLSAVFHINTVLCPHCVCTIPQYVSPTATSLQSTAPHILGFAYSRPLVAASLCHGASFTAIRTRRSASTPADAPPRAQLCVVIVRSFLLNGAPRGGPNVHQKVRPDWGAAQCLLPCGTRGICAAGRSGCLGGEGKRERARRAWGRDRAMTLVQPLQPDR